MACAITRFAENAASKQEDVSEFRYRASMMSASNLI